MVDSGGEPFYGKSDLAGRSRATEGGGACAPVIVEFLGAVLVLLCLVLLCLVLLCLIVLCLILLCLVLLCLILLSSAQLSSAQLCSALLWHDNRSTLPNSPPQPCAGIDAWCYFEMHEEDRKIVERIRRALADALARRVGEIRRGGPGVRRSNNNASSTTVAVAEERLIAAVCAAVEEDERENFVRVYTEREGFGGAGGEGRGGRGGGGGGGGGGFRYRERRGRGRGRRY